MTDRPNGRARMVEEPDVINKAMVLGATCLTGALLGPAVAQAQVDNGQVIVVTAPIASDTIALRDTPSNTQVIAGDPLTAQNHATLSVMPRNFQDGP